MMDFNSVYEVGDVDDYAFPAPRGSRRPIDWQAIARGESQLPAEIAYVRGEGKCNGDILGSGVAGLYLISSRLAKAFQGARFTGWKCSPVRFEDGTAPDGAYCVLSVLGRCGPVKDELSEVIEKTYRGRTTKWWKGLYFDRHSWDGSDIFVPAGRQGFFFVGKVRDLLYAFDLHGVRVLPLTAVERIILPSVLRH